MKRWMLVLGMLAALVAGFLPGNTTMAQGLEWGSGPSQIEFRGDPANSPIKILADMAGVTPSVIISKLREGKSLADVAKSYGIDVKSLIDKVVAVHTERLQKLVDNGRITQEQANSRIKLIRQHITDQVNVVWSEDLLPPPPPSDEWGLGPRMGRGMGLREPPDDTPVSILAKEAGVPVSEIIQALREGKSLADVAKSHGVNVESFIDQIVAAHTERLQQLVDDGRITQEQADSRIATLRERVTEQVNTVRTDRVAPRKGIPGSGARTGRGQTGS